MVLLGHFEAQEADNYSNKLTNEWKKLKSAADTREQDLLNAIEAQKYLANADDSRIWIEVNTIIYIFLFFLTDCSLSYGLGEFSQTKI